MRGWTRFFLVRSVNGLLLVAHALYLVRGVDNLCAGKVSFSFFLSFSFIDRHLIASKTDRRQFDKSRSHPFTAGFIKMMYISFKIFNYFLYLKEYNP